LDRAKKHIAADGRDGLIASVKSRLDDADARRGALGLAISVSAADGIVRTSERELIMELAEALEVDRDEAADMVRDITRP
jgi:tellurite resistance protein